MRIFVFCCLLAFNAIADVDNFSLASEKSLFVVDGDSVSLQFRLFGVDAPEINQLCRQHQSKLIDCGRLSKNHLKQLLKELPGELFVEVMGIDQYQRVLVRIYKGGVDIGALLVKQGMAFSYKDSYISQQNLAKSKKLGFWQFHTPPIQPYKWRKLNKSR